MHDTRRVHRRLPRGRDTADRGAVLTFERRGFRKRRPGPPWADWAASTRPLCRVKLVDGSIDDCRRADVHAEFANAFVGGGVMTGDAAQEETLFRSTNYFQVLNK